MPALEAQRVSKTFDRIRYVLDEVSLRVEPGRLVVLMGRSGSGKTTLLNLLAGLDTPSAGAIRVGGQDVGALDEDARTDLRLRRIGVVFQRFHLIPELTARENVELPMKLAGRTDAVARTTRLLEFFGLGGLSDAFPATLSGGETQRVALARALANEPAVVLADEPTANLDEANAQRALAELRRVATEFGTAVLIASHDTLTTRFADEVVHIADGKIRAAPATPAANA